MTQLLSAHDHMALTRTVLSATSTPDVIADLGWLRDRMLEGNTALVSMLYARRLWEVSQSLPPERRDGIRQAAVVALLYGFGASRIDGERCVDQTAPAHVRDGMFAWMPGVGSYIRELPATTRTTLIDLAVRTDARTATRRDAMGDIAFLCRNGLDETQYNLTHGSQRTVLTPPGQLGKTVVLTGDEKYQPPLRSEVVWKPLSAADRAGLRDTLTQLITPNINPPAPPRSRGAPPVPIIVVPPEAH